MGESAVRQVSRLPWSFCFAGGCGGYPCPGRPALYPLGYPIPCHVVFNTTCPRNAYHRIRYTVLRHTAPLYAVTVTIACSFQYYIARYPKPCDVYPPISRACVTLSHNVRSRGRQSANVTLSHSRCTPKTRVSHVRRFTAETVRRFPHAISRAGAV